MKTHFVFLLLLLLFFYSSTNAQCIDNSCECVYSLAVEQDTLWIGTKIGLFKYNTQNGTKILYSQSNSQLPNNFINTLKIDKDKSLWIGTYGGGLVNLKNNKWTIYNKNNSQIISNNIFGIEKYQNTLWLATDIGVATYNSGVFDTYNQNNSLLPPSVVFSFGNEGDSTMWIAARGGLYKYNGNWQKFTRENSALLHNEVYAVNVNDHMKYVCTSEGVSTFDGINWQQISSEKTLVFRVNPTNNEDWWVGTASGLKHFANQTTTMYNSNNSIMSNNYIQALVIDGDTKWIGTWGGGVYKISSNGWNKLNLDINDEVAKIKDDDFSIYPNPIKDMIYIEFKESLFTNKLIEIYNCSGQIVISKKPDIADDNVSIDISKLCSGIYTLKVQNSKDFSVKKIVKE